MAALDVLIPTYNRPHALAVTLTSLLGQTWRDFRLVVSDQGEAEEAARCEELQAVLRVLRLRGHEVELLRHLPRRGMAEQRQFLLDCASAPLCLFLDDDVILEPDLVERLALTLEEQGCGFVGAGLIGPGHADDRRPAEQEVELWHGRVQPELVLPDSPQWRRYRLHNAANLLHIQQALGLQGGERLAYKVAWVGGCVLFDSAKLRAAGGFRFWPLLPADHCGEDVLAQLLVMARFGGCGLLPTGAYHQQLQTTLPRRENDAPRLLRHLLASPAAV